MRTILILLLLAPALSAGDMAAEIRSDRVDYLLAAAFARYGPDTRRTITPDQAGVRFRLGKLPDGEHQVGVYSHFVLVGDFEIGVDYEVAVMATPQEGYGLQIGLAVHTHGPGGAVFVQRVNHPENKICWQVTHETTKSDGDEGKVYATKNYPSLEKTGHFVMRRSGKMLTVSASEKNGPPQELQTLELGPEPIYQIRLFADTGGADLPILARFSNLSIKADAITGLATPPSSAWSWTTWLLLLSVMALLLYAFLFVRRRRRDRDDD